MARKIVDDPSEETVANAKKEREAKRNPFSRMRIFLRQVIGELKKVITPTRKELLNFTGVVLAFVVVMMAIISVFDWASGLLVIWVFGG